MWGLARLFTEGFEFSVNRLVAAGANIEGLRERFRELFPSQPVPHTNTFNALLNRVRSAANIAERINKGVKPLATSYPSVPGGFDCEGFLYRVIVPVIVPEYGGSGRTRTVRMPLEIQSETNLNWQQIRELIPGAILAMQGTKDNYELLRLGIQTNRLDVGEHVVTDAYRC